MISKFTILFLFAIAAPLVWADLGSGEPSDTPIKDQERQSFLSQLPFFSEFSSLLQNFPGLGGSGFQLPGLAGSRHERSAEDEDEEEENQQSRFFFGKIPAIVPCNYTTNPGRSCATCTRAVTCLRNNVGIQRNCHGLFRHCNNGRCSLTQSSACSGSTTQAPTVAPTTVAPTTVAPITVATTTVAPTTVAPTTVAPTTVAPTTAAPV